MKSPAQADCSCSHHHVSCALGRISISLKEEHPQGRATFQTSKEEQGQSESRALCRDGGGEQCKGGQEEEAQG